MLQRLPKRSIPGAFLAVLLSVLMFPAVLPGSDPSREQEQDSTQPAQVSPENRTDAWLRKRQEKDLRIKTQQLSGFERRMLWVEKGGFREIMNFNFKGLYPKFSSVSNGSGFAPGVRLGLPNLWGTYLDLQSSAALSTRGYRLIDLQFGRVQRHGQAFSLEAIGTGPVSQFDESRPKKAGVFCYADLRYRYYPQEDYFGLGPDTRREDRTNYRIEDVMYDLVNGWQLNRWVGLAARVGAYKAHLGRGTDSRFPDLRQRFDEASVPGLEFQPWFFHAAGALLLDNRDRPGNPHTGGMLGFSFSRFEDMSGQRFDFNRATIDGREFIPLGSEQRVLALRFFTLVDAPRGGSRIPFYLQRTLGGSETLRGFSEFRFMDNNLMYLSAEYRWEPAAVVELALFYDAGKVFPRRSDFGFSRLERSYGIGIRFKTPNAVIMRLDVGRCREGQRLFFQFGPSF